MRLLTPNWQTRLPGLRYQGPDPDGYLTAGDVCLARNLEDELRLGRLAWREEVRDTDARAAES